METMTTRNVQDIAAAERQALEALLGSPLTPDQQVFVMAYTPAALPDETLRAAARVGLKRTFDTVDRHAREHGITPEEAEAAIDEAMEQIRSRAR